jgi:hypothetical protein
MWRVCVVPEHLTITYLFKPTEDLALPRVPYGLSEGQAAFGHNVQAIITSSNMVKLV